MEWCELTILAGASSLSDVSNVIYSIVLNIVIPGQEAKSNRYNDLFYYADEISSCPFHHFMLTLKVRSSFSEKVGENEQVHISCK